MIISASRRTDIPAYYMPWMLERLRAGFVLVRNPLNPRQVSRLALNPEAVDGFAFWTKNPQPMLAHLRAFDAYPYYVQFTLNAYGQDIEAHLPDKMEEIVPTFQRLADAIGPARVIWRYDPILLSEGYTVAYHVRAFEKLAKQLHGYTEKCTISFLDLYRKIERRFTAAGIRPPDALEQDALARMLSQIAHSYGLRMDTCAEDVDLAQYGIEHARCIDGALFERMTGCTYTGMKDKNQRAACGCMESVDIGAYNTCLNGCAYCYANADRNLVAANVREHNMQSPLLIGQLLPGETVTERKMKPCRTAQLSLL